MRDGKQQSNVPSLVLPGSCVHVFQQTARTPDASYVSLCSTELPLSSLVTARVESPRQEGFLQRVLVQLLVVL